MDRIFTVLALAALAQPVTAIDKHALIVGVTTYPNLAERFQLRGPAHDAVLLRGLITKSFGFDDKNVTELTEAAAKKGGDAGLPTRKNIEDAFAELAKKVREGDHVFIAMAGHGTQAPCQPWDADEEDGLDEVFLPRDAGRWNAAANQIPNGITDNDLVDWLAAIRDKGARVCIVLDCCYCGAATRANGTETLRGVAGTDALGIPAAAIAKARKIAADRAARMPVKPLWADERQSPLKLNITKPAKGGLVAISAALVDEPAFEREMPPRTDGNPVCGMLSFTMAQMLNEAVLDGKAGLTSRELVHRIHLQYQAWGRTGPTPIVDGDLADAPFLGGRNVAKPPTLLLTKSDAGFSITGGLLHRVTSESVFAVLPPPGKSDATLGYVKATAVSAETSKVVPVDYDGVKAVADLPAGGRVKLVFKGYGDMRPACAVDGFFDDKPKPVPVELREKIAVECRKLVLPRGRAGMALLGGAAAAVAGEEWSAPDVPVEFVADPAKATWLVRPLDDARVVIVPAAAGGEKWIAGANKAFGPFALDRTLADKLKRAFAAIAKVENLLTIALNEGEGDERLKLRTSYFLRDSKDPRGMRKFTVWKAFQPGQTGVTFRDDDRVVIEVENVGKEDVDVTLLYVDSAKAITCLFPQRKNHEENRVQAAATAPLRIGIMFDDTTIGPENLLAIAVPSRPGRRSPFRSWNRQL